MSKPSEDLYDNDEIMSDQNDERFYCDHDVVDHAELPARDDPELLQSGTEWVFEGDLRAILEEHPNDEADSPEVLETIVQTWRDFYLPICPTQIDYLVIFNDTSGNRITYIKKEQTYQLLYNVRVYMQVKSVTRGKLEDWIAQPVLWGNISGILCMDQYITDCSNASDPSSSVKILLTEGKRTEFRVRSSAWSFTGSIRLHAASLQAETNMQDFLLEILGEISTIPIPEILKALEASYCIVQCGIRNWACGDSDPEIPFRGLITGKQCDISRYNKWIPSFSFKPISGGLYGDPAFKAAVADAQNESSSWIEILSMGELKSNNMMRADKKNESDQVHNCFDVSSQSDTPPLE